MITVDLVTELRARFVLDWRGIHGAPHWARVRRNGLMLAKATGANPRVVEVFAFLHDACRHSDGNDPEHGPRAAALARELNGTLIQLTDAELLLLTAACEGHSRNGSRPELTIATCWDADRLDLGRVGIRPDPARLCTAQAKDVKVIEWAYYQSIRDYA